MCQDIGLFGFQRLFGNERGAATSASSGSRDSCLPHSGTSGACARMSLSDLPSIGIWPHERKRSESGMAKPFPVTMRSLYESPTPMSRSTERISSHPMEPGPVWVTPFGEQRFWSAAWHPRPVVDLAREDGSAKRVGAFR